jgi:hypothetical protein
MILVIDSDSDSSNGTSSLDAIYLATLFQEKNVEAGTEEGLVKSEKLLKEKSTAEKLQEIFNLPNHEELKGGTSATNSF